MPGSKANSELKSKVKAQSAVDGMADEIRPAEVGVAIDVGIPLLPDLGDKANRCIDRIPILDSRLVAESRAVVGSQACVDMP